jgi:hypothetical protein
MLASVIRSILPLKVSEPVVIRTSVPGVRAMTVFQLLASDWATAVAVRISKTATRRRGRAYMVKNDITSLRSTMIDMKTLLAGLLLLSSLPLVAQQSPRHFENLIQLTQGGSNGESYWSPDSKRIIFQSTRDGRTCDQEYIMNLRLLHQRQQTHHLRFYA